MVFARAWRSASASANATGVMDKPGNQKSRWTMVNLFGGGVIYFQLLFKLAYLPVNPGNMITSLLNSYASRLGCLLLPRHPSTSTRLQTSLF